jgi:putative membrane protein
MSRLRPNWLDQGEDPDYRYSLANERTFLAWIRTSLSLMAGAVAVVQLIPAFRLSGARTTLGAVLAATGVATAILAYLRWAGNERAMRMSARLPYTRALLILAVTLAAVGASIFALAVFAHR